MKLEPSSLTPGGGKQSRDEARAVIQTLRDYYAASNKQDVQQMVSYYHEPVMFMTPRDVLKSG